MSRRELRGRRAQLEAAKKVRRPREQEQGQLLFQPLSDAQKSALEGARVEWFNGPPKVRS